MITAPRQGINSQRKAFLSGLFDLYLPAERYVTSAKLVGMVAKVSMHEREFEDATFSVSSVTPVSIRLRSTIFNLDPIEDATFSVSSVTPVSLKIRETVVNLDPVEEPTFSVSSVTPVSLSLTPVVLFHSYQEVIQGPQVRILKFEVGN